MGQGRGNEAQRGGPTHRFRCVGIPRFGRAEREGTGPGSSEEAGRGRCSLLAERIARKAELRQCRAPLPDPHKGIQGTKRTKRTKRTKGTKGTKGTEGFEGNKGNKGVEGIKGTEGFEGFEGFDEAKRAFEFDEAEGIGGTGEFGGVCECSAIPGFLDIAESLGAEKRSESGEIGEIGGSCEYNSNSK